MEWYLNIYHVVPHYPDGDMNQSIGSWKIRLDYDQK